MSHFKLFSSKLQDLWTIVSKDLLYRPVCLWLGLAFPPRLCVPGTGNPGSFYHLWLFILRPEPVTNTGQMTGILVFEK